MENVPTQNTNIGDTETEAGVSGVLSSNQSRNKAYTYGAWFTLVCLALIGGFYSYLHYQTATISSAEIEQTRGKIADAYGTISIANTEEGQSLIGKSLEELRDIAANEKNPPSLRAQALNGINFAYTETSYDATAIKNAVFSQPPFSAFYIPSPDTGPDLLHPQSGTDVEAVELALVKLNELSNALIPNHYALSRMAIAQGFASVRESAGLAIEEQEELRRAYATKVKELLAAYDALSPLESVEPMGNTMRLQIMFVYASSLAFVGHAFSDQDYLGRGEEAFFKAIQFGVTYPRDAEDSRRVFNGELLARIFYANYYWRVYAQSDPDKIKKVLRPLIDDPRAPNTTVYKEYLPTHKDSTAQPHSVLRRIALRMPDLKTLLESLGWKF